MKTHFEPSTLYLDDSFSNLIGVGKPINKPTLATSLVNSTPIPYVEPVSSSPAPSGGMSSGGGTMMTGGLTIPTTVSSSSTPTSSSTYTSPPLATSSSSPLPSSTESVASGESTPVSYGSGGGGGYPSTPSDEPKSERIGLKAEVKKSFISQHKLGLSLAMVALLGFGYYKYFYKK